MKKLKIVVTSVEGDDAEMLYQAIGHRIVYIETISNPKHNVLRTFERSRTST